MSNESYITKIKIKIQYFIDTTIDYIYNQKIKKQKKEKKTDHETTILKNSENERKKLAKELGLSKKTSWEKIVKENDKQIEKKRMLYQLL